VKPPAARRQRSLAQVFAVPLGLALFTLAGLVVGLTGEGARDLLAWLLLAPPLIAFAVAWARRA
jgi:hypothetical protein